MNKAKQPNCGNCKHSGYPFGGKHVRCLNPKVEVNGKEEFRLKTQSCNLFIQK